MPIFLTSSVYQTSRFTRRDASIMTIAQSIRATDSTLDGTIGIMHDEHLKSTYSLSDAYTCRQLCRDT